MKTIMITPSRGAHSNVWRIEYPILPSDLYQKENSKIMWSSEEITTKTEYTDKLEIKIMNTV